MKKFILIPCLSLLFCSLTVISSPAGAATESSSDDQIINAVPFPKFKAAGLQVYGKDVGNEKGAGNATGHMVNIPVDEGSIAYLDFRPTASPDEPLKNSAAFRTFFGFHVTLN